MTQLPNGWTLTSIADIATFNPKTIADDSLNCAFAPMQYLGTRFLAQMNYEQRTWGEIKKSYVHFQTGDVIVAKVTPCFENGKAGIAPHLPNGIGAGSSEFCVFRPAQGIDKRYLLAWLSTENFRKRATVAMTGSVGLKRVPKEVFLSEEIPLAPEAEQRRIADKLDTTLARVDALNDRLARITPLLKRFRQSVLAAAVTGKLSDKNEIPWSFEKLKKISKRVSVGHVGVTSKYYCEKEEGIPFLRSQNVRPGRMDFSGIVYITNEFHRSLKKSQIIAGDLLVVRVGANRGDSCIVPEDFDGELNCANIVFARPLPEFVKSRYLEIYFQSPQCQEILLGASVGGAQGVINTSVVGNIDVPLPSLQEQTEIVRRVETLFVFADRLEARLQSAQTAAERLTPALLAKAFRGELVPQDPSDEPATELLRRLRAARAADAASKPKRGRAAKASTVSE